jgi:hypothetical protein
VRALGVDPGLTGALTLWQPDIDLLDVRDIPTMGEGTRRQVNGALLVHLLEIWKPTHAFIEEVTAMRGWGVGSTFRFGTCVGEVRGVIRAL